MERDRRRSSPPGASARASLSRVPSPPRQRAFTPEMARSAGTEQTRSASVGRARRPPVPPANNFPPLPGLPPMPLEALNIGAEIGKGRFKHVHRGILQGSAVRDGSLENRDVVVLRYPKGRPECKTELQVLSLLALQPGTRSYVPIVFGTCDQNRDLIVVQERATSGSLKSVVTEDRRFTADHGLQAALQVCRAMKCLESAHIVHADLSCRNILVFRLEEDPDSLEVKVTDFGLSVILKDGMDHDCRKQPQATRWCSPETVAHQKLSHKSDVWSLGALVWELFSGGQSPWVHWQRRSDLAARLKAFGEAELDGLKTDFDASTEFPRQERYPASAQDAILSCFQVCEHDRPYFADLEDTFTCIIRSVNSAREREALAGPPPEADSLNFAAGVQFSAEMPLQSEAGTASTSDTPTVPSQCDGPSVAQTARDCMSSGQRKSEEDRLMALLAEQEARLQRLQHEEQVRLEQLERLEQRKRLSVGKPPIRDTATPLSAYGVPHQPGHAAVLQGAWTLSSVERGVLRRQEFLDKEDAWSAFVDSADSSLPCRLRDPQGSDRASSSWIGADQVVRAQQIPMWATTHRLAAWMPSMVAPQQLQQDTGLVPRQLQLQPDSGQLLPCWN